MDSKFKKLERFILKIYCKCIFYCEKCIPVVDVIKLFWEKSGNSRFALKP